MIYMNKKNRTSLVIFLFFAVFVASCHSAKAIDLSSTEIIGAEGRVEVKKGANSVFKTLHKNLKLSGNLKRLDGGDAVRTYQNSFAEMALKNTCIMVVNEQSVFEVPLTLDMAKIQELKAQQGKLLFKVVSGSNFQVQTADVIAGVKGTMFEVEILDNFSTLFETPILQLGTLVPSATGVKVYEGEVELTHRASGLKKRLNKGESIIAFSPFGKINSANDVFGAVEKISSDNLISTYGDKAIEMLNIDSTSMSEFSEYTGLSISGELSNLKEKNASGNSFSNKVLEYRNANLLKNGDLSVGDAVDIGEGFLKKEQYNVDFSEYTPLSAETTITDRNITELYLNNKVFAACKAWDGTSKALLVPTGEGVQISQGAGQFKVCRYKGKTTDIEFLSSHYQANDLIVTSFKVLKGKLYGRIPGNVDCFEITDGFSAFIYNQTTGKANLGVAPAGAISNEISAHSFQIAEKIESGEKAAAKKNKENQRKSTQKLIEKSGVKNKIRDKFKKLW
ncbi:hypothetical protein EOM81_00040 [bacterium]|nr:hypothetical protein [bacterium]